MLTDHNYTLKNKNEVTSRDDTVFDIDVKVEHDYDPSTIDRGVIKTDDTIDVTVNRQTKSGLIANDEIKLEDNVVNQDITDQENMSTDHTTSSDMVCRSTTTEDAIHDIKAENDHGVQCGSTTTKALFADDMKVEVIEEIITSEECTNIEMMCRSNLVSDADENCGVMNQDGASESATNTDVKRDVLAITTIGCSIDRNTLSKILSEHNYALSNEIAIINRLPVKSRDFAAHNIDVKVENDLSDDQRIIKTEDTIDYDILNRQTMARLVLIKEIKSEDDVVNQDMTSTEHTTSSDSVCRLTTTEDVIHDIKAENDHDVECGSTTTKALFADDMKVEIKQEIITPEECTNIEMMCRSKLLSDADENCGVMNQNGASESASNTDVKRGELSLGEDYSSAAIHTYMIHKVQLSDTAVLQVTKAPGDSTALLSNMSAHSGKRQITCEVCHKIFPNKSSLARHRSIHSGEKPFTCKLCQKRFSQKSSLGTHMKNHLEEKPFACEVCHKGYSRKSELVNHMRKHSGEKPFTCGVCHKRFPYKSNLVKHMRKHSGEKPFTCEVCHKRFIQKSDLARHMRIHSGEKPFSCELVTLLEVFNKKQCLYYELL